MAESIYTDRHFSFYRLMVFDKNTDEQKHYNPKHWHDLLEITVCLTGASMVFIGGKEYRNKPGGVFVIPPRVMHMVQGIEPVSEDTGYCLQIDLRCLYQILPELRNISLIPECSAETAQRMISMIRKLEESISNGRSNIECASIVISIVFLICEEQTGTALRHSDDENMMEILSYIRTHYSEELSVGKIASFFHLSCGHLNRLFRTKLKQSVHSYLMDVRIEAALHDINSDNLSLTDICMRNGFPNHKSFIAEFRKRFSISPSEYRKLIRSVTIG
jgi:AraC-like DNA-binding protein